MAKQESTPDVDEPLYIRFGLEAAGLIREEQERIKKVSGADVSAAEAARVLIQRGAAAKR